MIVMKKFVLMGMMMVVGMTTFASLQQNDNRIEEFIMEYQEGQTAEMFSRELSENLDVTDVREFFRTNLNNYDE